MSSVIVLSSSSSPIFSKIIVTIDGSKDSINAADYAISIAKAATTVAEKHSSELILLHVMPSEVKFGRASGIFGVVPVEHVERMKQEAYKWFEKIRDKMIDDTYGATAVSTEVISTGISPQVAIVEYAEKKNIDLIVIGTRGMSGLKKLLLGSVALGVIKYSHCPVLVVK